MADDFERLCEVLAGLELPRDRFVNDIADAADVRAIVLAVLREQERIAIEQGRLGRDFLSDLIAQAEGEKR